MLSRVWLFATPWTAECQASLSITNSWSLLKLMSIESVKPSNHLILCLHLLPSLIFPSIRIFSNDSALCISWPKYWSFSFRIILPMNIQEWSPLRWTSWISLQSKGLKSLLQHHSSVGTENSSECMGPFEGGCHYLHYLHHSLASGPTTGREQLPHPPINRNSD